MVEVSIRLLGRGSTDAALELIIGALLVVLIYGEGSLVQRDGLGGRGHEA